MLPARGRPAVLLALEIDRELQIPDLERLAMAGPAQIGPPAIQKLKARHHTVAILLARGTAINQVAALTGLTSQRVQDLKHKDPAFRELLAGYEMQVRDGTLDDAREFHARLTDVSRGALTTIQERLADDNERSKMSVDELRRLAEMSMDRSTNPPKTAQPAATVPQKITFNIGPPLAKPPVVIDQQPSPGETVVEVDIEE